MCRAKYCLSDENEMGDIEMEYSLTHYPGHFFKSSLIVIQGYDHLLSDLLHDINLC